jgi:hypothetical protein
MQDGTGDPLYISFVHKYTWAVAVRKTMFPMSELETNKFLGSQRSPQCWGSIVLFARYSRGESLPNQG